MKPLKKVITILLILIGINVFGQSIINVNPFKKVVISPHILVTFIAGDKESVTIESNKVSDDKLNIEVTGETLNIYLDGAKINTKSEKYKNKNGKTKRSIYNGTIVTATITYKTINELSLRGDETFIFKSLIKQEKLILNAYGKPQISLHNIDLEIFQTTLYGAGSLEIKNGRVNKQKLKCYGECKIKTDGIQNKDTKIIAYGEANYNLNVSDNLKVTTYGKTVINYKGNPEVSKGIMIGKAIISKKQ